MTDNSDLDNPYTHSKLAQELELAKDFRRAEHEFKSAVRAADALPLAEYKLHFQCKIAHDQMTKNVPAGQRAATIESVESAYRELLALPFLTRIQLAGFYARNEAIPEAKEVCDDAFRVGIDEVARMSAGIDASCRRAEDLQRHLSDILGPENVEKIFLSNFDKLDINKDGFVDEAELKRAQLDITIGADAQQVIRYLLHNYLAVEKASNDEIGLEISGITKSDVHNYETKTAARWKRMKKKT